MHEETSPLATPQGKEGPEIPRAADGLSTDDTDVYAGVRTLPEHQATQDQALGECSLGHIWTRLPATARAETGVLKPKGSQARLHKATEPERGAQAGPEPDARSKSEETPN